MTKRSKFIYRNTHTIRSLLDRSEKLPQGKPESVFDCVALAAKGKTRPLCDYLLETKSLNDDDREALIWLIEAKLKDKRGVRRRRSKQPRRLGGLRDADRAAIEVMRDRAEWRAKNHRKNVPLRVTEGFARNRLTAFPHTRAKVADVLLALRNHSRLPK